MDPDTSQNTPSGSENASGRVTWPILLAKWTEFAQAAVSLPDDEADTPRWRESVTPIIGLQAVTMALSELPLLPRGRWDAARDMAEVLVQRHSAELSKAWAGEPMPENLLDLLADARAAAQAARWLGFEWVVERERVEMPSIEAGARALVEGGFSGDLFAARPGTVLIKTTPALFIARPGEADIDLVIDGLRRADDPGPVHQVYRQFDDETGEPVRDLVAPMATEMPPGMPLLAPVIEGGELNAAALTGTSAGAIGPALRVERDGN